MSKESETLESIKLKYKDLISKSKFPKFTEYEQYQFEVIETALKALEIIKKKNVNVGYLLICDDYEEYLDDFNDRQGEGNLPSFELLTQEEYNLLKEVLR